MKQLSIFFVSIFLIIFDVPVSCQLLYENDNVEVHRLEKNLYLFKETCWFTANILAITGDEGMLLMDTGFDDAADDLMDALKIVDQDLVMIINSHPHGDHIGGNIKLGKGIKKVAHVAAEGRYLWDKENFLGIDDEYVLTFSGIDVHCIPITSGHSKYDIIIHVPEMNFAYLGDLYLSESFPLVVKQDNSSALTVSKNLKEIVDMLPVDTRIFAGHGKETSTQELKAYIAMLDETISIVSSALDSGKSAQEIVEADLLSDYEEWGEFFEFITKDSWIDQICFSLK